MEKVPMCITCVGGYFNSAVYYVTGFDVIKFIERQPWSDNEKMTFAIMFSFATSFCVALGGTKLIQAALARVA